MSKRPGANAVCGWHRARWLNVGGYLILRHNQQATAAKAHFSQFFATFL